VGTSPPATSQPLGPAATSGRVAACLIRDLLSGEYPHPPRIVAFGTPDGWSRDVTVDIADELRRRYAEFGEVPDSVLDFMEANRS
jgi:hypothetical protein